MSCHHLPGISGPAQGAPRVATRATTCAAPRAPPHATPQFERFRDAPSKTLYQRIM